jgi:hypothetical protein
MIMYVFVIDCLRFLVIFFLFDFLPILSLIQPTSSFNFISILAIANFYPQIKVSTLYDNLSLYIILPR